MEKPNLRPAASSTRWPSGTTSLPMPSPATTAIRYFLLRAFFASAMDKALQLLDHEFGNLFGQVVAGGKRAAAYMISHAAPFVHRLEAALDHAVLPPECHHRAS